MKKSLIAGVFTFLLCVAPAIASPFWQHWGKDKLPSVTGLLANLPVGRDEAEQYAALALQATDPSLKAKYTAAYIKASGSVNDLLRHLALDIKNNSLDSAAFQRRLETLAPRFQALSDVANEAVAQSYAHPTAAQLAYIERSSRLRTAYLNVQIAKGAMSTANQQFGMIGSLTASKSNKRVALGGGLTSLVKVFSGLAAFAKDSTKELKQLQTTVNGFSNTDRPAFSQDVLGESWKSWGDLKAAIEKPATPSPTASASAQPAGPSAKPTTPATTPSTPHM